MDTDIEKEQRYPDPQNGREQTGEIDSLPRLAHN